MKDFFSRRSRPSAKDIDEEIRHHLELERRDREERGLSLDEARYAAMGDFGNTLLVQETTTAMWKGNPLAGLTRDFRQAFRTLRHTRARHPHPRGGNRRQHRHLQRRPLCPDQTAAFSRRGAARLDHEVTADGQIKSNSYPNFKDWREQARSFSGMASVARAPMPLTGISDAAQLTGRIASAEFLELLGVKPVLGRLYTRAEDRPCPAGCNSEPQRVAKSLRSGS